MKTKEGIVKTDNRPGTDCTVWQVVFLEKPADYCRKRYG